MKKILSLFLALLMLGSLIACTGETEDETIDKTEADTADMEEETVETVEENAVPAWVTESRIPAAVQPKTIYFFEQPFANYGENLLFTSMQALSAEFCEEQFIKDDGGNFNTIFNAYIEDMLGAPLTRELNGEAVTLENLAAHYYGMDFIKGYILCDGTDAESVHISLPLAGILDALIATPDTRDMLENLGYTCLLDVTDKGDTWLRESEYWEKVNRSISFAQPYDIFTPFDLAIFCNAYVNFYNGAYTEELTATYDFLDENAIIFGFVGALGEGPTVTALSMLDAILVPTIFVPNMSVFRGLWQESLTQKRADYVVSAEQIGNKHSVAFILSDGDNVACTVHNFIWGDSFWSSPLRGEFAMGWGMPALGIDLIPPVMNYYYESMTEKDEFVVALGGLGYTYPGYWSESGLSAMTEDLARYMKRQDMRYVCIMDPVGWNEETLADFTEHDAIYGTISVGSDGAKPGDVIWTNGKPSVSFRGNIGGSDETELFTENWYALQRLTKESLCVDPTKTDAYSIYYLQCWSGGMGNLKSIIDRLDERVEVVTVGELMDRMTANCCPDEASE